MVADLHPGYEKRILRVLAYMHDNPDGDLSLDTLADVAAMSRFHWHRVFRAVTGETCAQAARRLRLHRAAGWLVQSDRALPVIATAAGYSSPASFSRAFSEAYGCSPAAFRKAGRLLPPFPEFRTGGYPMHPITIRTEPARDLAVLPHRGSYMQIGKAFDAFGAISAGRGLWPGLGRMVGVYLDDPDAVPEAELRSFAGAELLDAKMLDAGPEGGGPADLQSWHLPGGRVAVLTYQGPYSGLQAAYAGLYGAWLPTSGEEPADTPVYEVYLNSPRDTAPADLVTEICLPLRD